MRHTAPPTYGQKRGSQLRQHARNLLFVTHPQAKTENRDKRWLQTNKNKRITHFKKTLWNFCKFILWRPFIAKLKKSIRSNSSKSLSGFETVNIQVYLFTQTDRILVLHTCGQKSKVFSIDQLEVFHTNTRNSMSFLFEVESRSIRGRLLDNGFSQFTVHGLHTNMADPPRGAIICGKPKH